MNKALVSLVAAGASLVSSSAFAASFYVDNSLPSSGKHDGSSWETAWLNPADVEGVAPGDVVYISGGPTGSTQTYTNVVTPGSNGADWHPAGGSADKPVTYTIGHDPQHDGTVLFDGKGAQYFLGYPDYNDNTNVHDVVISGDAGDGKRHFAVRNYGLTLHGDMAQNLRFSYIDLGHCPDGPIRLIPSGGGVEIDHVYAYVDDPNADHFSQGSFNDKGFDKNSAHDNEIYLPRAADTGDGADGFQWSGSGFSIYDNLIVGYTTKYTGGQHQDGMQELSASYVKLYGNTIRNMANSAIFLDGYGGDFTHVWVYDNVVTGGGVGISAGPDSGALQGLGRWPNFTDVVISNNTTADTWNIEAGVSLGIDPYIEMSQHVTVTTTFTDCVVSNNVVVNAAGVTIDKPIEQQDNVTLTGAEAPAHFVSYAPNAKTYDFHPSASDTTLRGKGVNLTKYFATDHDGNPRPASGAWDIGAYVYCGDHCAPDATGAGGGGSSATSGAGGSGGGGGGSGESSSSGCACTFGEHGDEVPRVALAALALLALAARSRSRFRG